MPGSAEIRSIHMSPQCLDALNLAEKRALNMQKVNFELTGERLIQMILGSLALLVNEMLVEPQIAEELKSTLQSNLATLKGNGIVNDAPCSATEGKNMAEAIELKTVQLFRDMSKGS